MKKIITLCLLVLLLPIGGCSKSDDPKELLRKAYEKQSQLSSYTYEGTMNISTGEEGGAGLSLPVDLTVMFDNKGTADTGDDEGYSLFSLSLFGQQSVTESWTVGNTVYTDDGYSKTTSRIETAKSTQDIDGVVSAIIDNAETITVEDNDDSKVMHVTLKEDAAAGILSGLGEGLSDLAGTGNAANVRFNDITLTIDKDGFIRSTGLSAESEAEDLKITMDITLTLKDEGKTSIPFFDPNEFTDQGTTDTESDYGDGSYEDIVFDDGVEILIYMDDPDNFMCYFDEEEQTLVIFNDDTILCDGLFVNGDFSQQLYDAILSGDADYTVRYESQPNTYGANAKMLVGYSPNDSEMFNAETPFSVITFDDGDIGLIFVGYGSEEEFKNAMDQLSFDLYTEQ